MSAHNESLADLATQAVDSIDTLLHAVGDQYTSFPISSADCEVEAQRLKLWASNLNLWHVGHGSLDYRLRDAPSIHQLAQSLLGELVTCLRHLNDIVSGERPPFEDILARPEETGPTLPPQDYEADGSDSSKTSSSADTEEAAPGEVKVRWGDLLSIIQKLYKFSTDIRNSSTRAGPGDRPVFPCETVEKQNEFLQQLAELEVRLIERHLDRCREEAQIPLNQVDEDSQLQYQRVVKRLGRANGVRRQHFRYWHEQNDKRQSGVPNALQASQNAAGRPAVVENRTTVDPQPNEGFAALPVRSMIAPSNPTSVTRLDPAKFRPGGTSVYSRASANNPVLGPIGEEVPWPVTDNLPTQDSYFECPYCSLICPTSYARSNSSWRAHVRHDIRPYCCTYPDCESGSVLFDDRKEWSNHEKFTHRKVYKCTEHPEFEFDESDYVAHVEHIHTQYLDQMVSLHGLQAAASTTRYVDRICPLCFTPAETLEAMESHLIYHLECIALLTLPRATGLEEGSQKDEAGSASMIQGTNSRFDDSQLADWSDENTGIEPQFQIEPSIVEVPPLSTAALDDQNNDLATLDTTVENWMLETSFVADDAVPGSPPLTRGNLNASSRSSAQTSLASSIIGEGFVLRENEGVLTLPDEYQADADLLCPFLILDCDKTFRDMVQFKRHVFSHFRGHALPESASCFLCDNRYDQTAEDDPALAWNSMLSHMVRDHYRRVEQLATVRTDFGLMRWMYTRRLINDHQFSRTQLLPELRRVSNLNENQMLDLRGKIHKLELEKEACEEQGLPLDPERAYMLDRYQEQLNESLKMEADLEYDSEDLSSSGEETYQGKGKEEAGAASDKGAVSYDQILVRYDGDRYDGERYRDQEFGIRFPPNSIKERKISVRALRQRVAMLLDSEPSKVQLVHKGRELRSNQATLRLYGLRHNSGVDAILTERSVDYERLEDMNARLGIPLTAPYDDVNEASPPSLAAARPSIPRVQRRGAVSEQGRSRD